MNTQSFEEVMELEEGRQRELAAYAEELIKQFPEITLRSWFLLGDQRRAVEGRCEDRPYWT